MVNQRAWWWLAAVLVLAGLLVLLAPVLTPFALAALLAYLGDPLVDRLEKRVSRGAGVVIVFVAMGLIATLVLALLIPEIIRQAMGFPDQLQKLHGWFDATLAPWLVREFGLPLATFNAGQWLETARAHLQDMGRVLPQLFSGLGHSGALVLGWIANLLLIPVITFYLLRDWDVLVHGLHELLPRPLAPTISRLAGEADAVLAGFLRGQLSVMAVLAIFYALGLSLAGIEFGLLIGVLAGLLSFVPYLGPAAGISAGLISALVSPGDPWLHVLVVAMVFVLGQVLESFWLTPQLVGDRIGLHPVAVIFAVMAGGQLFGFFGVLLALPVAAVVMVLLRHSQQRYLASHLYGAEAAVVEGAAVPSPPPAGMANETDTGSAP